MRIYPFAAAAFVLAALIFFAACEAGEEGAPVGSPQPSLSPTAVATAAAAECPIVGGQPARGLIARLEFDGGEMAFPQGQPIEMTLTLINCDLEPVTRSFKDAQRYDFMVSDEGGAEVWRWSADQAFAQVTGEETFQPGQKVTYSETWDQTDNEGQSVPPGTYQVTAMSSGCSAEGQNCGLPSVTLFLEITAP